MKFPLILSCGHTTRKSLNDVGCECHSGARKYLNSNEPSPVDNAHDQFHGQWATVLGNYGCQLPSGRKHGPCPVCGGKDRFRFDDKNGRGTWFCSQCEPSSGGGLLLLSRFISKSVMDTAKELTGDIKLKTIPKKKVHIINHDAVREANIEQAKKGAALLMASSILGEHEYLNKKGLFQDGLINGESIYSREGIIAKGDLLLVPVYKNNELVNVQKITKEGEKRPLFGGDMQSVNHVIDGTVKNIAVVEGYATGITINNLTKFKTYVAFNTGNLEAAVRQVKTEHPEANIIVFGDHDKIDEAHNRRPGEYYANKAADPFCAKVALPPELGDWDDYRQAHGDDECKAAMRSAIGIKAKQPKAEQSEKPAKPAKPAKIAVPEQKAPETTVANAPVFGSWMGKEQPTKTPKKRKTINDKYKDLPKSVSFEGLDIDKPPGLAGEIVKYIEHGAHRMLTGGAFSASAIQTMAMAGHGIEGFQESKLSLITITLGVSAGGKEQPQKVMKELLNTAGIHVYGDIRSDKDVLRSAVYDKGKCFYVIDEAHKLLSRSAKDSNPNADGIMATLMNISTTSLLTLAKLHQNEFSASASQQVARFEKQLSAKEDIRLGYNKELEKEKIKVIDFDIERIKNNIDDQHHLLNTIESGVKNPCLNLAASSTPQKMSDMINEDNIEQGFLGRGIIVDCGSERSKKTTNLRDRRKKTDNDGPMMFTRLKAEIGVIAQASSDSLSGGVEADFNGSKLSVDADDEAFDMICEIEDHYEKQEYRNHDRLGPLYARVLERVINLSSIMALGNDIDGVMTINVEHVRFALLLALNSIAMLQSNLKVNEAKDGDTIEAKLEGIKEAITKKLDVAEDDPEDGWRLTSKIKANIRRQKFYQEIEEELLKHDQSAFNNAIFSLQGGEMIDVKGKYIRLSR